MSSQPLAECEHCEKLTMTPDSDHCTECGAERETNALIAVSAAESEAILTDPARSRSFDRDGNPISILQWTELYHDENYVRVGLDRLTYRGFEVVISTVWLGTNHNYGDGPPVIFETQLFSDHSALNGLMLRYPTLAEAVSGHWEVWASIWLAPPQLALTARQEETEQ